MTQGSEGYTSLGSQVPPPGAHVLKLSRVREGMSAAAFVVVVAAFVGQTALLGNIADNGYQKPLFTMYITHSCMTLLLPLQFVVLWAIKPGQSWSYFYQKHTAHLKQTAYQITSLNAPVGMSPFKYFVWVGALLSVSLNVAGASWYIAVGLTSTAVVTAIYNCSIFSAYLFSMWLLKERYSTMKLASVLASVVGVLIITFVGKSSDGISSEYPYETLGNIIIAVGTILYGLYDTLYKKVACPPQEVSSRKQAAFANFAGSIIGLGTLFLMWPVLILAHLFGWETFALPPQFLVGRWIASIACNVAFSGAFLIVMSLTSPVLGSVSSVVATIVVPVVNYLLYGKGLSWGEVLGGLVVMGALLVMILASKEDFEEEE